MGFFESLGEGTERVKQKLTGDDSYVCLSCEKTVDKPYEHCPHCGEASVVEAE